MSTYFHSPTKRIALLLLGGLGLLVCLAGIVGVWTLESRLNRVRQQLATAADDTLEYLAHQATAARVLVSDAKLTVGEVEERLGNWTRDEITDRASDRLELDARFERLAAAVDQTQRTMASVQQGLDSVQKLFVVAGELGLPLTGEKAEALATRLVELRSEVDDVTEGMAELRHHAAGDDAADEGKVRVAQAVKLAGRLVATFGKVDEGLRDLATRIANLEGQLARVASRTRRRMLIVAAFATLLLLWMAAGQVSLLRRGIGN